MPLGEAVNVSVYVAEHTHPADDSELREARFKNALKERVRSEPHVPAPEVYSRQIVGHVGQVSEKFVPPVWHSRIYIDDKSMMRLSYVMSVFFFSL